MIKEILQSIDGVALYPIISLFMFGVFFLYILISTIRMKQSDIDHAGRLPLDSNEPVNSGMNSINRQSTDSGENNGSI